MMSQDESSKDGRPLMEGLREELFQGLDKGPAATELERRKLLARLERSSADGARYRSVGLLGLGLAAAMAAAAVTVILFGTDWREEAPGNRANSPVPQLSVAQEKPESGTVIRVPEGAGIKLVLRDRSVVWLGARAELELEDGENPRLTLREGRMIARVTRRREGDFRVATSLTTVVVKGTTFSVQADAERTMVRLHEGSIALENGSWEQAVAAGEEVEVDRSGRVKTRSIDADDVLADLMIVEQTDDVDAPEIQAGLEEIEAASNSRPRRPVRRARRRDASVEPDAGARVVMGAPEVEQVRFDDLIEQDSLYWKAYREARRGRLAESRRLLEHYLKHFPEGRYWQRVREILGEPHAE